MHTPNGIHLMKMKKELLSPLKCDAVPGIRVLSIVHQDTDEQGLSYNLGGNWDSFLGEEAFKLKAKGTPFPISPLVKRGK